MEQAAAFVRQLRQLAADAADGAVLPTCERAAPEGGRALLRGAPAAALRGRVAAAEQRGGRSHLPPRTPDGTSARSRRPSGPRPSAVGRAYFVCAACGQGDFGADRILGINGYVSVGARRMACLAGLRDSLARAEKLLTELAGWQSDDETVRRLRRREAGRTSAGREERATAEAFAAEGDGELQIDAGKVNTEGAIATSRRRFTPRASGARRPTRPAGTNGACRPLHRLRDHGGRGGVGVRGRCAADGGRLGLTDPTRLSALGDGAEWIWNLSGRHFPGASENLGVFHGAEQGPRWPAGCSGKGRRRRCAGGRGCWGTAIGGGGVGGRVGRPPIGGRGGAG